MSETYYVYMIECADHTLYTGITNNVAQRMKLHHEGKGAKYTRGRGPFQIRYLEKVEGKSLALQREQSIKKLSRSAKWQLIEEMGATYVSSEEL